MSIAHTTKKDIPELVKLINSAYRGDESKKGWTTEATLLKGDQRIDIPGLTALLENPTAQLLKYTSLEGTIAGCVYLEKQEKRLYLGMLTVSPRQQTHGIGRQLLSAAETYAREQQCPVIFMSVISVRHELLAWYERKGYYQTGETRPFPTDNKFGIPTQPLEFLILEKKM